MPDLPAPLQQLVDRFTQLAEQFQAGHISQDQALSILAASTTSDATGAIWAIAPTGYLTRAAHPGDAPQPADPSQFIPHGTPLPPSPAFPAPAGLADLDTPPNAQSAWGPATGPSALPAPVLVDEPAQPKSLKPTREPRDGIAGTLTTFLAANKLFTGLLLVGLLAVIAAVVVPRITSGHGSTPVPVATTPGAKMPVDAPAATATTPSTTDATAVISALESGDTTKVQAMISAALDPVAALRTQSLWKGVADTGVTVTPEPAAATATHTATQVWKLTRAGEKAPTATLTVTWVSDGKAWKLSAAPTF